MANILGINLSEFSYKEVLEKINVFLLDGKQHYIVTPNPEIILASHVDEEFFYILNEADISLADGFGLKIATWIFGDKVPRITGADITVEILKMAASNKIKVVILNWENGLSSIDDITDALTKKFSGLVFSVININRDKFLNQTVIDEINKLAPTILFNTLGFPYQEKLLYHNLKKLPSIKLGLGIGGSFDFITEKIKRAPKIFRSIGMEWFWRLLNAFNYKNTGSRIKRIYRAIFVFLAEVLKVRFINPRVFRKNVACLLYKREGSEISILIVERTDIPGHWQLPQGGTDGEDLKTAGSRELREELGTDKFIPRATFKKVHRYEFKLRDKHEVENLKKFKFFYKGQSQGLLVAEFTGTDNDIKINFWDHQKFKWVKLDKFIESVHPVRMEGYKEFLKKFQTLNIK
ncbi:MAG: WecB/TagA/CpsF family glycosyltransferase [Patescibacteria group bacterium]